MTKQLIELHGGCIEVNSREETYTGVASTKPASMVHEVAKVKLAVLVVDDEMINRMVLKGMLQCGYEVLEAYTCKPALEQVNKNPQIALVLMDILMPEMNGFEACTALRSQHSPQ